MNILCCTVGAVLLVIAVVYSTFFNLKKFLNQELTELSTLYNKNVHWIA